MTDTTTSTTGAGATGVVPAGDGVTFTAGITGVSAGDTIDVLAHGVTNPATAGASTVSASTTADETPASVPFTIAAPAGSVGAATLLSTSPVQGESDVHYAVDFLATDGLGAGDAIVLDAPAGTVFPSDPGQYEMHTDHGYDVTIDASGLHTVTITVPAADVFPGTEVGVNIDSVTNASPAGNPPPAQHLNVSTTADPSPVAAPFALNGPVAVTALPAGTFGADPGNNVEFRKADPSVNVSGTDPLSVFDQLFAVPSSDPSVAAQAFDTPTYVSYLDLPVDLGVVPIKVPAPTEVGSAPLPGHLQDTVKGHFVDTTDPGVTDSADVNFAMVASGFIQIPTAGTWKFNMPTDDGYRLQLGAGLPVVGEWDQPHVGTQSVTETLPPGLYPYRLTWFQNFGGDYGQFATGRAGRIRSGCARRRHRRRRARGLPVDHDEPGAGVRGVVAAGCGDGGFAVQLRVLGDGFAGAVVRGVVGFVAGGVGVVAGGCVVGFADGGGFIVVRGDGVERCGAGCGDGDVDDRGEPGAGVRGVVAAGCGDGGFAVQLRVLGDGFAGAVVRGVVGFVAGGVGVVAGGCVVGFADGGGFVVVRGDGVERCGAGCGDGDVDDRRVARRVARGRGRGEPRAGPATRRNQRGHHRLRIHRHDRGLLRRHATTGVTVVNDSTIVATSPSGTNYRTVDVTVNAPGGASAVTPADQFSYTDWTATALPPTPAEGLGQLACTSTTRCTATAGANHVYFFNGLTWTVLPGPGLGATSLPGTTSLFSSTSCLSATDCTVGRPAPHDVVGGLHHAGRALQRHRVEPGDERQPRDESWPVGSQLREHRLLHRRRRVLLADSGDARRAVQRDFVDADGHAGNRRGAVRAPGGHLHLGE